VPAIDGRQILELKFRYETPSIFKRLVEEFALTPKPASKYRLGMAATGQAPLGDGPLPLPTDAGRARRFFYFFNAGTVSREPLAIFLRLIVAMVLGGVVALIYRRTRYASDTTSSLTGTLVFLSILNPTVTQVIGDNVARAFSLVGALSIVRFRTVVRD